MTDAVATEEAPPQREVIYRHALATRITHWVNFLCLAILLMSGLQILNAHPRLYWGQYGANADRPVIAFTAVQRDGHLVGVTQIGALHFETTGLLGVSKNEQGQLAPRGVARFLTLPSFRDLATGRRWHFFFAWILVLNGLAYLGIGFWSKHIQRDLAPRKDELQPRHLWADVVAHAKLHVPRGEESKRYNTIQKLAYLAVIFGLIPLMVLTGLSMSPGFDAVFNWAPQLFGGRQSARLIHFLVAMSLVAFVAVHLFEIFLVGVWNEVRSMITGYYEVKPEKAK